MLLASELRVTVMRLSRRLRTERPNVGLSLTQIAPLGTIDRHGSFTPREIADHERVQPPSMTRILSSLEALGLIERTPHPRDGRQHRVALTKAGKDLLREDKRRREGGLAQRLAELTVEERELLAAAAAARIIDLITRT